MDSTARKILIAILERLRYFEKTRQDDLSTLLALVRTVKSTSPELQSRFNSELARQREKAAADPALSLDDIYDGLTALLRSPDPPAEDEQERLRRLLEAFEGPKQ
jgi:hypothetical protein